MIAFKKENILELKGNSSGTYTLFDAEGSILFFGFSSHDVKHELLNKLKNKAQYASVVFFTVEFMLNPQERATQLLQNYYRYYGQYPPLHSLGSE